MAIEIDKENMPKHIAIIMDGNRRWAREKHLPDVMGHKEGAENLKRIAKFANSLGIKYMTVYAFSTENWKRAQEEVEALMFLFKKYLTDLLTIDTSIRVKVIGRRHDLPKDLLEKIVDAEEKTKDHTGMTLNVAINYGGRDEITNATREIAKEVVSGNLKIEDITEQTISDYIYTAGMDDPDMLIRPGGEKRTSNFLPWQLTYAEFIFTKGYWPAFSEDDLLEAIHEYQTRTRKFGGNK